MTSGRPNPYPLAAYVTRYQQGMSIRQIARELGVSYGAVRDALIRAGVELRGRGGYQGRPHAGRRG
ncbi:helix-turn-helix domain-containing protein [Salinactinospora qingdaonensis]|uniref:Helix-turn-helix domain-containing protein n=1 Tax=Salinactinospora qingdaonensis TaxID=702744 RepID=A0ABP7FI07_9ACTN